MTKIIIDQHLTVFFPNLIYVKTISTVRFRLLMPHTACEEVSLIKYAHNTYDGMTRKIPSKDIIVLLPEEKANSCQRESEC